MTRYLVSLAAALVVGCSPQPRNAAQSYFPTDSGPVYVPFDCGCGPDTMVVLGPQRVYLAPIRPDTVFVGWTGGDSAFVWTGGHPYRVHDNRAVEEWLVEREARRLIAEGIAFNRGPR